jgi:hypothetical protein
MQRVISVLPNEVLLWIDLIRQASLRGDSGAVRPTEARPVGRVQPGLQHQERDDTKFSLACHPRLSAFIRRQ